MEHPAIRQSVIDALRLASSLEMQRRYQVDVPIADVTADVFCTWEDFYHPADSAFQEQFNTTELQALAEFEHASTRIARQLPERLSLHDFQARPECRELADAASVALAALGLTGDDAV